MTLLGCILCVLCCDRLTCPADPRLSYKFALTWRLEHSDLIEESDLVQHSVMEVPAQVVTWCTVLQQPCAFELLVNWMQPGTPRTTGPFKMLRRREAAKLRVAAGLNDAGTLYHIPPSERAAADASTSRRLGRSRRRRRARSHTRATAADGLTVNWVSLGLPSLYLFCAGKSNPGFHAPSVAVDWGARGLPSPAMPLWVAKRRLHQSPSVEVDWAASGRPSAKVWRVKRAAYRPPSVALDWSTGGVPPCDAHVWVAVKGAASEGAVEDAPGVDWSGRGLPLSGACACSTDTEGVSPRSIVRTLSAAFGSFGRACARLFRKQQSGL